MDKRLQEIIDNFDKMKIGIDDTFRLHCTQCGKCCINREDILLNPKDLFNLAKGLNISVTDVIKQYCEVYLGQDSRIPIVRLLPKGQIKRCPFLKDKKCSVHKFKPTVCATFPLGRVMTYSTEASMPQGITPGEVQYIFTDPGCGDNSETHTVREWLSDFDIALEDEFFMKWNEFISSLGNFIRLAEKKFLEKRLNRILDTVFASVYCLYNPNEQFLPQFERNVKMLEIALKKHGYKKEKQNEG